MVVCCRSQRSDSCSSSPRWFWAWISRTITASSSICSRERIGIGCSINSKLIPAIARFYDGCKNTKPTSRLVIKLTNHHSTHSIRITLYIIWVGLLPVPLPPASNCCPSSDPPPQFITPNSPTKISMLPVSSIGLRLSPYLKYDTKYPMKTGMPVRITSCPVFLLRPRAAVIVSCPNAKGSPVIRSPTRSTLGSDREPTLTGYIKQEEMRKSIPRWKLTWTWVFL